MDRLCGAAGRTAPVWLPILYAIPPVGQWRCPGVHPYLTAEHAEIAKHREQAFSAHSAKRLALPWRDCALSRGTAAANELLSRLMDKPQRCRVGGYATLKARARD